MNCRAVRSRLVACQDRELSPAEELRVREHLDACADCRHLDEALAAVTPRPFLPSDPVAEAALWERLDAALDAERARGVSVRAPNPIERARTWLSEDTRMPTSAVIAYAALLLLAVAWGTGNWWEMRNLQASLDHGATRVTAAPEQIPADQYRPAAFHPESDAPRP